MLRWKQILGVLAVAIFGPILTIDWWLPTPLFTITNVDEEFPSPSTAFVPYYMTRYQVEKVMSGIAGVDQDANADMLVPVGPATELASALSAGDSKAMDAVVKILADSTVKSMLGNITAPAKDEMTQAMAKAMMDGLPEATTGVGT